MKNHILSMAILCLATTALAALDPTIQAKVDARVKAIQAWGSDPVLVEAVKAQNDKLPAELAGLNQDKWKEASILDPAVRGLTKNPAADFLKKHRDEGISEAFINDASGNKVGFLAKTTGWNHKGKAKHDQPMAGKTWQGDVEVDESSGLQQVQVAVPILDGDKPIGSLVVGLAVSKL